MNGIIFEQKEDNGEVFCLAKNCNQAKTCIYKTNPAPHKMSDLSCSKMCPKNEGTFDND